MKKIFASGTHIRVDGDNFDDIEVKPGLEIFTQGRSLPAGSPQQMKLLFFEIREVLTQLNRSFRYSAKLDPKGKKVEF